MTRITPNGRVKNPLMRPFGVIRVIGGYSSSVVDPWLYVLSLGMRRSAFSRLIARRWASVNGL